MPSPPLEPSFVVKEETLNRVLGYLSFRPYREVSGLIKLLNESLRFRPQVPKEVQDGEGNKD